MNTVILTGNLASDVELREFGEDKRLATFRLAVEGAGLSRALAVGDADKVLAITNKQLARRGNDQVRAPYLVHQALAHELRGDAAAALASAESAKPVTPADKLLQTSVRILALVEAGKIELAFATFPLLQSGRWR